MSTVNSFGTRTNLNVGGRRFQIYSLPALAGGRLSGDCPAPFLAEDPARESAAARGRPVREGRRHRGARALGRQERRAEGDFLRAGPRAAAGLHRRAGGGRSGGHARRHRTARRRPEQGQPAAAGGARHRPFGAGRLLRARRCVPAERRARILAQQGALCVPALGPERVPQLPRRAARHRHRPSGQPRISRSRGRLGRHGGTGRSPIRIRWSAPTRTRR